MHPLYDSWTSIGRSAVPMIAGSPGALYRELKSLGKGRGVSSPRLTLGSELQRLCKIASDDSPALIRSKLRFRLDAILRHWSSDQREMVLAVLGMRPDAPSSLMKRMNWLARDLGVSERTATRRVNDALLAVAHDLAAEDAAAQAAADVGYFVEGLEVLLRMDSSALAVQERRKIHATRELGLIPGRFSVPSGAESIDVELLFGGTLATVDRPSASHVRYVIEPPRTLHMGEIFSYEVLIRMPECHWSASHYVVQPLSLFDALSLHVRFDLAHPPARVWRVDGAPPRMIDDRAASDRVLALDRAGQVAVDFRSPNQGLAYGLAWSWSEDQEPAEGSGMESH